jgi:protein phosphatase
MSNRFYYAHDRKVLGPVSAEQLRQLVATGDLLPDDMVWPEAGSPGVRAPARTVLASEPQLESVPDWVADTWAPEPPRPRSAVPDWVADVEVPAPPARRIAPPPPPPEAPPDINVALVPLASPVAPAAPPGDPSGLRVGGHSSVGRVRDRNEDRFFAHQWAWNDGSATREGALLIVADGMGGYEGGDRASSTTVRAITEQLLSLPLRALTGADPTPSPAVLQDAVAHALEEANRIVLEEAKADARFQGMGATAAVVLIWDGRAFVSHVGDCRVYLQRGDALAQLTADQTLVGRMVELGQLTPEEAREHPRKNEVLQAVGKRSGIEPSRFTAPLLRGDRIVVACDGLDAHVPVEALQQLLASSTSSPANLAAQCVRLADEGGGSDNCTVVIAHFG